MTPTLQIQGVEKRYGVKTVLDKVSFAAARGECVGIIGPNGAGKTTLFNVLDGSTPLNAGKVMLDGVDLTALPQYRRARSGIGRAYQIPRPFFALSVYENVLVGALHRPGEVQSAGKKRALEVIETVGLADKLDMPAGGLPLLDRKRLELAKAMSIGTEVLLLDEIAAGLTEQEVLKLIEIVKLLTRDHVVLWIEHIAHALMAAAERIIVLHFGAKLFEGKPAEVLAAPIVHEVYLESRSMNLLALENVDIFYGDLQATFGVTLHVDAGETIAIIGANGAGKSTLLHAIIGLAVARHGRIVFDGEEIARVRCDLVARRGIALVPEGRRLFSSLSVEENLLMGAARARPGPWTVASVYELFLPCANYAISRRPISPAASSRWSRSGARCSPTRGCCCATSFRLDWRQRSSPTSTRASPGYGSAACRSSLSSRTSCGRELRQAGSTAC